MSQERLTQYKDQLYSQQAAYFRQLPETVTAQPLIGVERFQYNFRREKKLIVNPPNNIVDRLNDADLEAIHWVNHIDVIEYDSGKPGDLMIVTSGMHGEETLGELAAENLDDEMKEYAKGINKGKVLLLPRINTLGYINKTRCVFPDEADTNLNNVFNQFKTGEWDEFLKLESKTAKYGWLLMKYLTNEKEDHRSKFGNEHQIRLIDLHRDDRTAIPYNRIDRMYEDPETLSRLFNAFKAIPVPLILEDKNWKDGYEQALSSVATLNGILACTIEEGRTSDPDQFAQMYISYEIMQFLIDHGIVVVDSLEWSSEAEMIKSLHRISAIKRSRELAAEIVGNARIYCLNYLEGSFLNQKTWERQTGKDILSYVAGLDTWDGIFTVAFRAAMRGLSSSKIGGTGNPSRGLADVVFGKKEGNFLGILDPPIDMIIQPPTSLPDEWFIVSVPESLMKDSNVMYCAFNYDREKKSIRMKSIGKDDPVSSYLRPSEIRELLGDSGISIDFSPIDITYALPDFMWVGSKTNDTINFIPIDNR